jgi:hypothetical protein
MSLLSAFAAIVRGSDQFEERVSTVLQRELAEPTVEVSAPSPIEEARAREPEPLSEPEPQKATVFMKHKWGPLFPVDNGGPTFAHQQKCVRCKAVARRVNLSKKAGKGVTCLLPGMPLTCPGI